MCIILLKMCDFLLHKNSLDFMLKLANYKKNGHAFLILAETVYTYLRAINAVFSIPLKKKKKLLKIAFLK